MDIDEEYGRLFESLKIEAAEVAAVYPPFDSFGNRYPRDWSFWGYWHVPVHSLQNPKNYHDVEYRNSEGRLHRLYGPAYISKLYNYQSWYKDGLRHREDGPAYIHNTNMVWFYEDKLHNLNGPAVVGGGTPKQYWIMGARMCKKEYDKEIRRRKKKGLL